MYRERSILPILVLLMLICSGCTKSQLIPLEKSPLGKSPEQTKLEKSPEQTKQPVKKIVPTLIVAAKSNDFKLIKDLLISGVQVNVKDDDGKSALWHAFKNESFEAFKILLENGASPDLAPTDENVSGSYGQSKFYHLVREYELFSNVKRGKSDDLPLFDAYFSKFSNGHYLSEVEKRFEMIVKNDYADAMSDSAKELRQFVKKYSGLGQNCYLIAASDLNIRASHSINASRVGEYDKGEKVFARAKKGEWIQTDRGWINVTYTKQIKKRISVLQPYLQKAIQKLGGTPKPDEIRQTQPKTDSMQPKTETLKPKIETRKPEPRKRLKDKNISETETETETELNNILRHPTLDDLEAFINKYQHDKRYRSLVKKAKDEYKMILLRGLQ